MIIPRVAEIATTGLNPWILLRMQPPSSMTCRIPVTQRCRLPRMKSWFAVLKVPARMNINKTNSASRNIAHQLQLLTAYRDTSYQILISYLPCVKFNRSRARRPSHLRTREKSTTTSLSRPSIPAASEFGASFTALVSWLHPGGRWELLSWCPNEESHRLGVQATHVPAAIPPMILFSTVRLVVCDLLDNSGC